jgi:hypothetical protein
MMAFLPIKVERDLITLVRLEPGSSLVDKTLTWSYNAARKTGSSS